MLGPFRIGCVAAVVLGVAVGPLHAQKLAAGSWTGTMSPPDDDAVAVTYDVAGSGDSLAITMHGPGGRQLPFSHIRFENDTLLFEWSPGETNIRCALVVQADGGYKGPCTDSEGKTGQLVMVPPKP
jgi:hypothetical protein